MPSFKSTPEREAAGRLVEARLSKSSVGETITYSELSEIAHCDIKRGFRYILVMARKRVMRDRRMLFGAVVGVGIKRLDDVGICGEVSRDLHKVHRAAYRGLRKSENIGDLGSLPAPTKTHVLAEMSCLGAIAVASKPTTIKRIEVGVQKTQARLPLEETLKAFGQ